MAASERTEPLVLVIEGSEELAMLFRQFADGVSDLRFEIRADEGDARQLIEDLGFPDAAVLDLGESDEVPLLALARTLRSHRAEIPVFLLCDETPPGAEGEVEPPWTAIIPKPFVFADLVKKLEDALLPSEEDSLRFTDYPGPKTEQLEVLTAQLEKDPADQRTRHMLAFALYSGRRYAEALPHYERLHGEGLRDYVLLYYLGQTRVRLGRYLQAAEAWTEALEHAPSEETESRLTERISRVRHLATLDRETRKP